MSTKGLALDRTVFSSRASYTLPKSHYRDICKQMCQQNGDTRFNGTLKIGVITATQNLTHFKHAVGLNVLTVYDITTSFTIHCFFNELLFFCWNKVNKYNKTYKFGILIFSTEKYLCFSFMNQNELYSILCGSLDLLNTEFLRDDDLMKEL